jgi:glutamate-1-semialdehyde 2,1-aminomutase
MKLTLSPWDLAARRMPARLALSRAKHASFAGHAQLARRIARVIPHYEYGDDRVFASDGAPPIIADRRRAGFARLAALYHERFAESARHTDALAPRISDLQLTASYRVPFPYSRYVRSRLKPGSVVIASAGTRVEDLDGNRLLDLSGSYGLNVFGYDFYKACLDEGITRARALGPVLGSYHPSIGFNVEELCAISGLDEVSFHMSGTEAVLQAVRLARYHTGRSHVVRFAGAYHGFSGDVQPGIGNPHPARETYTLRDLSEASLAVLARRTDIACVLVNPMQALHPNRGAPSDSALLIDRASGAVDRPSYARFLARLREICSARGIVLIFDEVFSGFRLARGGAQEYFGVPADLVTYGKTLGGGLPVGVVCGRRALMRRFRPERPIDICFARGTFSAHPYVMSTMHAFLSRLADPDVVAHYSGVDDRFRARAVELNRALASLSVPVTIETLSSVWTVCYTQPSRYHWMLQYYLRAQGLLLSWTGTGRLIFPIDLSDEDFRDIAVRFLSAAQAMKDDGFFWSDSSLSSTSIKLRMLSGMVRTSLSQAWRRGPAGSYISPRST